MSKTVLIGLFLLLLAAAAAFGVARDLYSSEQRTLAGEIVEIKPIRQDFKATLIQPPRLKVKLEDGQTVDVATASIDGLATGAPITISEMATPWGQIWYRVKN